MKQKLRHKLEVIVLYLLDNNRAQALRVAREAQELLGARELPEGEDHGDVSDHLLQEVHS